MSSVEEEKYGEIKRIVGRYLTSSRLSKIACLTNCQPNQLVQKYIAPDLNYICFCASSLLQMSQFLFMRYLIKYGKIPFDIFLDTPYKCLQIRRFSLVCLEFDDVQPAQALLRTMAEKKKEISREYPIMFRAIINNSHVNLSLPSNCALVKQLDEADLMVQID